MARPRYQAGSIVIRGKRRKMYVARYYETVIGSTGEAEKVRRSVILGSVSELESLTAAKNRLADLLRPLNNGAIEAKPALTFGDFVRNHWEPNVLSQFKHSTQCGYRALLKQHLLPFWEKKWLSEITPAEAQGFFVRKKQSGLTWNSLRNLRNLLSRILRTAADWEFLEESPAKRVKLPPKPVAKPKVILTLQELRSLLQALAEPSRTIATIAVLTGLRRGELFALRWSSIDLVRSILMVRESVYMGRISTPKTKSSVRSIPMSPPITELFRNLKAGSQLASDEEFVFSSRRGIPMHSDNILKRVIQPACDALKLPRIGWHTFRHIHATLLSATGESLKTAQAILGHSDLETTLQVYTHSIPEAERRAEKKVAEMVLDPNGPKFEELLKMEPAGKGWIN